MIFELLYNDIIVPGRFMLNKRAILGVQVPSLEGEKEIGDQADNQSPGFLGPKEG